MKKLYTINTVNNFMDIIFKPFVKPYCDAHDIEVYNIMDDSLLKSTIADHGMKAPTANRMINYALAAQAAGADGILVTCTSVNQATRDIKPFLSIPIINIEEPVAEMAVANGKKIGVLATLPTSPVAIDRVIREKAAAAGKEVEIIDRVAEGAFDILCAGDRAKHDQMVCECLYDLAKEVDVIVFAQISMSLLKFDADKVGKPIYMIGESGLARIDSLMK